MEYKQPTRSVLARLMGLDELPPLQPVQKRQRVLSDNYLQRVASIGVKEKHVECHSFRLNVDEQKEYLDIFRLLRTSKRAKHNANSVRKRGAQFPSDANISQKSMEGKSVSVEEKNISRSKMDVADLRTSTSIPGTRIVLLKPHLGNLYSATTYSSPSAGSHMSSLSEVRKHKGILSKQISNNLVEVDKSKNQATGMGSFRPRSRFSKETARKMGSISAETPQSKVIGEFFFAEDSTSRKPSSHNLTDVKNKSFCSERTNGTRESKKQILESWTATQKYQQVDLSSRRKPMHEELPIDDNGSMTINLDDEPNVTPLGTRSPDDWQDGHARDLSRSRSLLSSFDRCASPGTRTSHKCLQTGRIKSRKLDFQQRYGCESRDSVISSSSGLNMQETLKSQDAHENKGSDKNSFEQVSSVSSITAVAAQTGILDGPSVNHEEQWVMGKDDHPALSLSISVQQDKSDAGSEEDSVTSHYSGMDPESPMSLEEIYQPSPNSVLGPLYEEEMLTSSDCFKSVSASLHGLQLQLELLKSETSETYSEGSSMVVSSDDDDIGGGSVSDPEDKEVIMRPFEVEESRDFSYLVDVLIEAGLHSRNPQLCLDTWNSHEGPISSSVFETLEKKYGEQISWKRSDRRLIFDRTNSGLMEILQPSMGVPVWKQPVARRFSSKNGQVPIEEELWVFLVSQEKEAAVKNSGQVLGKEEKLLDLVEDIQDIGREIENSLIDELLADVVSMERF